MEPRTFTAVIFLFMASILAANGGTQPLGTVTDPPAPVRAADPSAGEALSRTDQAFLKEALRSGRIGVAVSELAARVSPSDEVRQFARQVVDERGRLNRELTELATLKGVELPEGLSLSQRAELMALKALSGRTFDKIFAARGVRAQEKALAIFRRAVNRSPDADVRALATRQLPLLQSHLEAAQTLRAAVGRDD